MVGLIAFYPASAGDESTVRSQIQAARVSITQNRFDRAIHQLLDTLGAARRSGTGDETVGEILNDLGYSYRMLGRCRDAISLLERANWLLRSSTKAAISGVDLASAYLECGQPERAAALWDNALAPMAEHSASATAAPLWAAGATIEAVRERYVEAEALASTAIGIWEQALAANMDRLALARIGRGVDRAHLGQCEDATADVAAWPALTRLTPSVRATALGNIALAHFLCGQLEDARAGFEKAVALLGPTPTDYGAPAILANYAALLRKMGDSKAAAAVNAKAREAAERVSRRAAGSTIDLRLVEYLGARPASN